MSRPSRMESARRRVRITRYAIGVVAAGALAGGAVVARAAHPGTHGQHSTSAQAAIPSESSSLQAAAGGSSSSVSPAPAASQPVVQSSGS
jgi:Na+/H+-dicarboxylate symporter